MYPDLPDFLAIDGRASLAFGVLTLREQNLVLARLESVVKSPADQWPELGVRPLPEDFGFLLPIDHSLVVNFTQPEPGHLVVEDIFRREFLRNYYTQRRGTTVA